MGYSIGDQLASTCAGNGGNLFNCATPGLEGAGQGNYAVGFYGPGVGTYGSRGWNQWETWFRANTPGNSDGFLRVYLNGVKVWDIESFNFNSSVDMTGMDVEAGGWYTKNVWTNNGRLPNAGGTCSPAAGVGREAGGWVGAYNASSLNAANCPPAPPAFNRYIDDIIVLEK
jgi:hypothetical protein